MLKDFATSIIQTLRQDGFQAYLAGGCVRDLLLKREPADYDIATSAAPAQVMEIFPDTYAVGAQFGVRAGNRLRGEQIRFLLALLVLAVAIRLIWGLVVPPPDFYSLTLGS